jgi:hypothetical protein
MVDDVRIQQAALSSDAVGELFRLGQSVPDRPR